MNHSNHPNCSPDGALTDIEPGEEMTMDYSFHGNPPWYQDICAKYGVLTERQVTQQARAVRATLQYLKPGSTTAQYIASQAGDAKEATHEGDYVNHPVTIENGRPVQD